MNPERESTSWVSRPLGGLLAHVTEDELTAINHATRARICPIHDTPLTASFDRAQWVCPEGDVVMTLDDAEFETTLTERGIVVHDDHLHTLEFVPSARPGITGVIYMWLLVGLVAALDGQNGLPHPLAIFVCCGLGIWLSSVSRFHTSRALFLAIHPGARQVPADDHETFRGIPGSDVLVPPDSPYVPRQSTVYGFPSLPAMVQHRRGREKS